MYTEMLIEKAREIGGSDIHLVYGLPPKCRVSGRLENLDSVKLDDAKCIQIAKELAEEGYGEILTEGELDLARTVGNIRIRANLFMQQGHISAAIRLLSDKIPQLASLGLPPAVLEFPMINSGIVLVTGETGSGKSTTLAAILNEINHSRDAHIITLEDPIEYIYEPDRCIINQREVGSDTKSYENGLRAILREDPDVILIGEMRDRKTIETALTAAETGHLVFATLHTNSAVDAVDRIVGTFPADSQNQIRLQLSTSLQAVLSQQLLVRKDGRGRVAACELMVMTPAIRNSIREGKTAQMGNYMLTAKDQGSVTMDNALIQLWKKQLISAKTAKEAARDKEYMKKQVY